METPRRSWLKLIRQTAVRLVLVLLLAGLSGVVYLSAIGFPDGLRRAALKQMSAGDWVVEAEAMQLAPPDGLLFKNVALFRKGIVGPPVLACQSLTAGIRLSDALAGRPWLQRLELERGIFRPRQNRSRSRPAAAPPSPGGPSRPRQSRFELVARELTMQGVHVAALRGNVSIQGPETQVQDLDVRVSDADRSGRFRGQAHFDAATQTVKGRLVCHADPHLLLPLVDANRMGFCRELIERFDFGSGTPRAEFDFHRHLGESGSVDVDGRFWLEDARYRGVDVLRGDARVNLFVSRTNVTVRLDRMLMLRPEGLLKGAFTVEDGSRGRGIVDFDVSSGWHPDALVKAIGLPIEKQLAVFRFEGPAALDMRGRAAYRNPADTDIRFHVACRNLGMAAMVAEEAACRMRLQGANFTVSELTGTLMDGDLSGSLRFLLPLAGRTNAQFSADLRLDRADFNQVARAMGGAASEEYRGDLTFRIKAEGPCRADWAQRMTATGRVRIESGRVFMLPVFGGLSKLMSTLIPGLDFVLRQSDLRSDFVVQDGVAQTDDVQIEGDVLSLTAKGKYRLDKQLDFTAQVTLMKEHTLVGKLLRTLTAPISMLMEFRLKGTLEDPRWYPVNFSRDLLERIGLLDEKKTE